MKWNYAPAAHYWWAVPAVALVGALVALYSILANRHIARMRATLDLIERTESSEHYLKIRQGFKSLATEPGIVSRLMIATRDPDRTLRHYISSYLNHYELIAIGCRSGILDENFYARWMRTALVKDWVIAKEYILAVRTNSSDPTPNAFIDFENLARRFESGRWRGYRVRKFKGYLKTF